MLTPPRQSFCAIGGSTYYRDIVTSLLGNGAPVHAAYYRKEKL